MADREPLWARIVGEVDEAGKILGFIIGRKRIGQKSSRFNEDIF